MAKIILDPTSAEYNNALYRLLHGIFSFTKGQVRWILNLTAEEYRHIFVKPVPGGRNPIDMITDDELAAMTRVLGEEGAKAVKKVHDNMTVNGLENLIGVGNLWVKFLAPRVRKLCIPILYDDLLVAFTENGGLNDKIRQRYPLKEASKILKLFVMQDEQGNYYPITKFTGEAADKAAATEAVRKAVELSSTRYHSDADYPGFKQMLTVLQINM